MRQVVWMHSAAHSRFHAVTASRTCGRAARSERPGQSYVADAQGRTRAEEEEEEGEGVGEGGKAGRRCEPGALPRPRYNPALWVFCLIPLLT